MRLLRATIVGLATAAGALLALRTVPPPTPDPPPAPGSLSPVARPDPKPAPTHSVPPGGIDSWRLLESTPPPPPPLSATEAEWILRRALYLAARRAHRLPPQLERIELANGNEIWAVEVGLGSDANRIEITTPNGIHSSLPKAEVKSRMPIEKSEYLRRTEEGYRQWLAQIDRTSASALFAAIARALAREDGAVATELYSQWRATDGHEALADRLEPGERASFLAADRAVHPAADSPESVVARPKRETRTRAQFEQWLASASSRLTRLDRILSPRARDERSVLLREAIEWWVWLDREARATPGSKPAPPAPSRLRRELQALLCHLFRHGDVPVAPDPPSGG